MFFSTYALSKTYFVNHVYDLLVKITAEEKLSDDIVVVSIDDKSIKKVGRWPWKRTKYTDIMEYLENEAGAKLIAFDSILVSYGDKKNDEEFFKRLAKLKKVVPGVFFSKQKNFFHN